MRKLFRFKYEPCNKTCYAWCQVLIKELRAMSQSQRERTVNRMVKAHDKLCDNPDYSFGVDLDEDNNVFVAHFRTPNKTDVFSSFNFADCVNKVTTSVMSEHIPYIQGQCNYGQEGEANLGYEILNWCKDEAFAELQEQHCLCKENHDESI